ncbi:putative inorganic polyphosphate/ATP-NAD kinase [compost metagenome]
MNSVGIVYNGTVPRIAGLVPQVEEFITSRGKKVFAVPGSGPALPPVDLVVVLGGDGTFLRAARLIAPEETPILSVDLGTLGFLAEVEYAELPEALDRVFAGEYRLESRTLLDVRHHRDGETLAQQTALNEGVVLKGTSSRMLELEVFAGESLVARYGTDGMILATPTGSTAYALSAGGPIMAPDVPAWVLAPICPHTLTARPLVMSSETIVRVVAKERAEGALLSADGFTVGFLKPGDEATFRRSEHVVNIVKVKGRDFFNALRDKLRWGDPRQDADAD